MSKSNAIKLLTLMSGGGGGITFPYDFDPTGLSSFPAGWTGSNTFIISGDLISNSPTLGTELLADPGLEGTYTDGANGSLIITGGTATEVTSGVHGGSKAQGWEPDAAYQSILDIKTPEAQQWYKMSGWLKRTAGSTGNIQAYLSQYMSGYSRRLSSASYVQLGGVVRTDDTANLSAIFATNNGAAGDVIVLDDVSLKKITKTTLPKLVKGTAGLTAKIKVTTWDTNSFVGVVSHSDGTLDNCLLGYYQVDTTGLYAFCVLDQYVAGVRTNLVATYTNSPWAGSGGAPTSTQWLEIRYTDTNKVTLFHNDIAVGTEQSIPAELQANTYYGIMDTGGGNSVNRFFAGELTAVNIGAGGSSNTNSASGYFQKLYNVEKPQYLVTKLNASANGQGITTYTLDNYANLAGSVQVVADTTGDNTNPDHLYGVEAFIRKCHADGYKLLIAVLPYWTDPVSNDQVNSPANETMLGLLMSLLDHYGVAYFDMWAYCQAHVTGGGNLSDLFGDIYHPTDAGHLAIAVGLAPYYVTGGTIPSPLAARVYAESEALE